MSIENLVLLLSVGLGFVHLAVQGGLVTKVRGAKWNLSSRDEPVPPLKGTAGRADRAFDNFKETFPFFLAAVFLVMQTGRGGTLSSIGACLYLAGRAVYLPLYLMDVTGFRTAVWAVSACGIILVLVQSLIG